MRTPQIAIHLNIICIKLVTEVKQEARVMLTNPRDALEVSQGHQT